MSIRGNDYRDAGVSLALVDACYTITDLYRTVLRDLSGKYQIAENEMLVLVSLAGHPEARTQKKLQDTELRLSGSTICRVVESLRRKGFLTTRVDERDRRSWILSLEEKGELLAEEASACLARRMNAVFTAVPGFDPDVLLSQMSRVSAAAGGRISSGVPRVQ